MTCNRLVIDEKICMLYFFDGVSTKVFHHNRELGETVRGEQVIAHCSEDDSILSIELLSSELAPKPCMDGEEAEPLEDWVKDGL